MIFKDGDFLYIVAIDKLYNDLAGMVSTWVDLSFGILLTR